MSSHWQASKAGVHNYHLPNVTRLQLPNSLTMSFTFLRAQSQMLFAYGLCKHDIHEEAVLSSINPEAAISPSSINPEAAITPIFALIVDSDMHLYYLITTVYFLKMHSASCALSFLRD